MVKFEDIIDRMKDSLSIELGNKKIFDKNIAYELSIEPHSLSVMKSRNKIPYPEITEFCNKRKVNYNWLIFGVNDWDKSA